MSTTVLCAVMNSDKALFREFMVGLFRYVSQVAFNLGPSNVTSICGHV